MFLFSMDIVHFYGPSLFPLVTYVKRRHHPVFILTPVTCTLTFQVTSVLTAAILFSGKTGGSIL